MPICTVGSAILVIIVKAIIPKISSIIAAPKMALPARVFSLPISLRVSTVILTDVAVKITPMKMFCSKMLALASDSDSVLNAMASRNPPAKGTSTPISAMINDARPVFFSSLMSVSIPAVNINTITPISDTFSMKLTSPNTFRAAGPSTKPASKAPTT